MKTACLWGSRSCRVRVKEIESTNKGAHADTTTACGLRTDRHSDAVPIDAVGVFSLPAHVLSLLVAGVVCSLLGE